VGTIAAMRGWPARLALLGAAAAVTLAPQTVVAAPAGPVLVVVAHPDDEALGAAGVIEAALAAGRPVFVAVVTNGDAASGGADSGYCGAAAGTPATTAHHGLTRDGETSTAMGLLGLDWSSNPLTSDIFFLGYPDGRLVTIAGAAAPWTGDASSLHRTYAEDGDGQRTTCNGDLHYLMHGTHAGLDSADLAADFDDLLALTRPTDVYTHAAIEGHPDHAEVTRQIVSAVQRAGLTVTVHEAMLHPQGVESCLAFSAGQWPNPADSNPFDRFTPALGFTAPPVPACSGSPTGASWGDYGPPTEIVPVPADMQATSEATNRKWQLISRYASQIDCTPDPSGNYSVTCGYLRAFAKREEIFWRFDLGPSPPPAGWDAIVSDAGCRGCAVATTSDGVEATIQGGADTLDTAYAQRDFGGASGWTGRTYVREVLRLGAGQTLGANLSVLRILDVGGNVVYELYIGPDRVIRLFSPSGGLRATSINSSTGITVPNDGSSTIRVEVAAGRNDLLDVRVDGVDRIVMAGLAGGTTGDQRYLRAGIDHYDTGTTSETVTAVHASIAIGQSGWFGAPGPGSPPGPPANTAPPTISGTPVADQKLTASTGSWSGSPTGWAYQWYDCDGSGTGCAAIAGATGSSYTLVAADVGHTMVAVVTAANAAGTTSATSPATGVVSAPIAPPGWDAIFTDAGCGGCAVSTTSDGVRATIQGGADAFDTAWAQRDFGGASGWTGRTYVRDVLRLAAGQTLRANLSVLRLFDAGGSLIYEVYVGPDRVLRVFSPSGGLRASSINSSTGVVVPNDGSSTIRVEVAAGRNDVLDVRVDGVDRIVMTGLAGATSGNQRYVRAGIDHYDTSTTSEIVTAVHASIAVGQSGWLGAP
jgi:LmbE family N-acetylglucosaminyl deacetylase